MSFETRLDNNKLTRSTDSSKHEETYEPEVNPDHEPSSSDSLDTSSSDSRAKKNKSTKKKKRRKHRKDDSSYPSLINDSDSSDESHYRRKRRNNKKHRKKDLIRLCATLTAKFRRQRISQRSSGLKWMRIRYSAGFTSSHLYIHLT